MSRQNLVVVDHAVTGESFTLVHDQSLDMLTTTPLPEAVDLPRYYESQSYISHTDARETWFDKVYQLVKRRAIRRKLNLVHQYVRQGHLLDIGAGTAEFVLAACSLGWQVIGTEPAEQARRVAAEKGISLARNTAHLPSNKQDVITMWHVLEHVSDVHGQIREVQRLLKKEGVVFVAVPNFKSFDAHFYGCYWAGYDVPRHLFHFSRKAIETLFEEQNMQVKAVHPMYFDAFYVSLLSEKYKRGKMSLRAIFVAAWSNLRAVFSGEYSSLIYVITNK